MIDAEDIDITQVINEIQGFRNEIINSIKSGDITFLPNASVKELPAYKNAASVQGVKGATAWNIIFPENMIEFPAKVVLLKVKMFTEKDIEPLKETHPIYYERIINGIFHDKTGMFVKVNKEKNAPDYINERLVGTNWWDNIPKKYRTKYKKLGIQAWNEFVDEYYSNPENSDTPEYLDISDVKGLQVIAIPKTETIPKWLDPYIDYSTLVNSILAPFNPVMEIFGVPLLEEGKVTKGVNRKTEAISNIIKF